jgi:hypothetical protein
LLSAGNHAEMMEEFRRQTSLLSRTVRISGREGEIRGEAIGSVHVRVGPVSSRVIR